MNNQKLYVGNLPYTLTSDQLGTHFAQAGQVSSATVIADRQTGRSKGFGFVEMASPEDAQKAIEMFHGKELDGRTLVVNVARPLEPRAPFSPGGGGGFRSGGGDRPRGGGFRQGGGGDFHRRGGSRY